MVRTRAVVVLCAVVVLAGACGGGGSEEATSSDGGGSGRSLATLAVIDTQVDVDGEQGSEGQGLAVGQVVSTNPSGFGEVSFFDGSLTRVAQDASYTVTELSDDEGERRVVSSLDDGTSWNRVEELSGTEGEFSVETPVATATATGTAFVVDCVALPESCTFTVVEGTVEVTLADGTVIELGPGETVTVTADEDPPEPVELDEDELAGDEWIARNLALDAERGDDGPTGPPSDGEEMTVTGVLEIDFDSSCATLDTDDGVVELAISDDHTTSGEVPPSISFDDTGAFDVPPFVYAGNEVRASGTVTDLSSGFDDCGADVVLAVDEAGLENLSGVDVSVTGVLDMDGDCGLYEIVTPDGDVDVRFLPPEGSGEIDVYGDMTTEPPTLRAGDGSSLDDPVLAADGDTVTVSGWGAVADEPVDSGCGPLVGVVNATADGVTRG